MHFLDRPSFAAGEPDGRELLAAAISIYESSESAKPIVKVSGVPVSSVFWDRPMADVSGMVHRGTEAGLAEVLGLLDAMPSVLHVADHNAFSDEIGSLISLDGSPLRPDDLSYAKQKRAYEPVSPLVFFNGCRTAGGIKEANVSETPSARWRDPP